MIVDTHTHLLDRGHWPSEWWQWVADNWASRDPDRTPGAIRDRIEDGLIDPDGSRMLANMNAAGVDVSVVLPIDWGPDFTGTLPIEEVVEHALSLGQCYPGRIVPFCGIDPRRPHATALVDGWINKGAKGVKMYPSCGWDPNSDKAHAIYEIANEHRLPVLFHTGDPLPLLDRTMSNPLLLAGVAAAHPDMPIWLGHAGAPHWWAEALSLAAAYDNVRVEMSVWIWDDSGPDQEAQFVEKIAEALRTVGREKILFGTDHVSGFRVRPAGFLRRVTDFYRTLPRRLEARGLALEAADLAAIMGENALRDLGMAVAPGVAHE